MDIATSPIASSTAPVPNAAATTISSDFDTFLRLLTTQISNQDPLEPMKAEEFAAQLATFSNVEQSVKTNDLLEAILAAGTGDEFTAMSGWIGREVRAPMSVQYSGQPVSLDPLPPVAGSRHELVVRSANGAEIDRRQIDSTGQPIAWSGTTSSGGAAPDGVYSFAVESFEGDNLVASEGATAYARVLEVRYSAAGPTLAFAGGVEIPAASVSAVREAA